MECAKFVMYLRPSEAHSNQLIIIIGRISNLRADIIAGNFPNAQEIVSAASALDAELIAWLAALPPGFSYEHHTASPYDFDFQQRCRGLTLYDDQYHVYPNLWVCNSWNQYRCARIIVSEIILSHIRQMSDSSSLRSLSDEFRMHCRTLRATIRRLAVDICRSVPFHLGAHLDPHVPANGVPPPEGYLGGLMLLWPLFLAGVVENPNHQLRRWVVQCLRMIGNTMGLDQSLALMDIVAADPGILRSATEAEAEQSWITDEPNSAMSTRHPVSPVDSPLGQVPTAVEDM